MHCCLVVPQLEFERMLIGYWYWESIALDTQLPAGWLSPGYEDSLPASAWRIYKSRLNKGPQVWWILFLLLLATASCCLQQSRNLEPFIDSPTWTSNQTALVQVEIETTTLLYNCGTSIFNEFLLNINIEFTKIVECSAPMISQHLTKINIISMVACYLANLYELHRYPLNWDFEEKKPSTW